jgi:hypothetical protein
MIDCTFLVCVPAAGRFLKWESRIPVLPPVGTQIDGLTKAGFPQVVKKLVLVREGDYWSVDIHLNDGAQSCDKCGLVGVAGGARKWE